MRIGVPSGRLRRHIPREFAKLWSAVEVDEDNLVTISSPRSLCRPREDGTYFILRSKAIPALVAHGILDEGYCGSDSVDEFLMPEMLETTELCPQQGVTMVVAAADPQILEQPMARPLVVGTSYPVTASRYLSNLGKAHIIVEQPGCVEGLCPSLVDLIVDIAETGTTLHANNLVILESLGQLSVVRITRAKA